MTQPSLHHKSTLGKPRVAWLLLACLQMLLGCSGLLPKPTALPARYLLSSATPPSLVQAPAASAASSSPEPSLTIDVPYAAPAYDNRRMLYLRRPHQLEAFAFHEWVDTPAQMLQPLLVTALQSHGYFRVVLTAHSAAETDFRLETELLRLQQDFTVQPSQVRLRMRAVLMQSATRQALAWRDFDANVPASSDDPVAGVEASQVAAQQVLAAIAAFCAEQASQHRPSTWLIRGPIEPPACQNSCLAAGQ